MNPLYAGKVAAGTPDVRVAQGNLLLAPGIGAITLVAVAVGTGVPIGTALLLTISVMWQALSGWCVWRKVRPTAPGLEQAGAALSIGTLLAALAGVATSTLGLGAWGWFIPSVVAVTVMAIRRFQDHTALQPADQYWNAASGVGFAAGLLPGLAIIIYGLRSYPLTWTGNWNAYHPDMPFFEAISVHIAQYGAFSTPFLTEGAVRYHWLSYAWAGQLTLATNAAPFITITRVLPVVALLGSAAMVASWTWQLSKRAWTPALAGLLLSLGGFTGAVFGGVLTMDSPSQSMSVLWLLAFSIMVISAYRDKRVSWTTYLLLGVAAFGLVGAKVSAAAPAVAGVLLLIAIGIFRREIRAPKALSLLGSTLIGSAAGFLFFLAGSLGGGGLKFGSLLDKASSQQGLNPIDTRYAVVVGTVILVLAVVPRWAGIAWLLTQRPWRWQPEITYSVGLAVSSLAALLAFNSFNEVWFSSTVSGPLAVTTAVGAGSALTHLTQQRPTLLVPILVVAIVTAIVIYSIVWRLWITGASGGNVWVPTLRWLGPIAAWGIAIVGGALLAWWGCRNLRMSGVIAGTVLLLVLSSVPGRLVGQGTGLIATQENGVRNEWFSVGQERYAVGRDTQTIFDWSDSQREAGEWIRDNVPADELIGTNLTFSPLVPALTHRRTYVSAIQYQSPYGFPWMSPILIEHEDDVWGFLDDPNPQTLYALCEGDVRWLWIDKQRTEQMIWEPFASVLLENNDVILAQIDRNACRQLTTQSHGLQPHQDFGD